MEHNLTKISAAEDTQQIRPAKLKVSAGHYLTWPLARETLTSRAVRGNLPELQLFAHIIFTKILVCGG